MQQHDISKKHRNMKLLLTYVFMTIAVVVISTVSILLVLGYRFNLTQNVVERGALLQFKSFPTGANITVDDEMLSFKTPGKRDMSATTHDITYSLDGYRNWTKQVSLKAGEVRWLNYARLVPTTVNTTIVKEIGTVAGALPNKDGKKIAVLTKLNQATIQLFDVSSATNVTSTTFEIPAASLTTPAGSTNAYSLREWSPSGKYLLVRHTYGSTNEFLRVNASDPADTVNLSTKFGVTFDTLRFSTDTVFYGIENGNLRKFDLGASSLSEPLVHNAVSMVLYGDSKLAYVQHDKTSYKVGVVIDGTAHDVVTYDDTILPLIDFSNYYNNFYLAVSRGSSVTLVKSPEKIADGASSTKELSFPNGISWLNISPEGRFVLAGRGNQFLSYDIEIDTKTDVNFPGTPSATTQRPQWLDSYILVASADAKLRLSDYDGDNQQIVTGVLAGYPVMLSSNQEVLYSFSKTGAGSVVLQASNMTTK